MNPLVTIICLCYNHARFLREALDSIFAQTYQNIEVIVVDDASTDNSVSIIQEYVTRYPAIQLIANAQNCGNCRAFNQGLRVARGAYIIDFATDDILLPTRVAEQIFCFESLADEYGAIYTDATLINEHSQLLRPFYKRNGQGQITSFAPSGDIYAFALERYFICTPTLIFRKAVFDRLQGYDETLAYEDFDFIVRTARNYKFYYLDQILTQRRLHPHSLSRGWYKIGDKQLASTVKVCRKALILNQTEREKKALSRRVEWEIKQAYFTRNFAEAEDLFQILNQLKPLSYPYRFLRILVRARINLSFVQDFYYRLVHRR